MSLLGLSGIAAGSAVAASSDIAGKIPGEYLDIVVILGLVFIGLLLIIGILQLLKLLIVWIGSMYKRNGNPSGGAGTSGANQAFYPGYPYFGYPAQRPSENLVNDPQLVAVITAALMASMEETPADGLVIRSIRRK